MIQYVNKILYCAITFSFTKLKPYSSNYYHTEWKDKSLIRHNNWASRTFESSVSEHVRTDLDMFLPPEANISGEEFCPPPRSIPMLLAPRIREEWDS